MKHLPAPRMAVVDGQQLAHTVSGQGSPTIVLINGAGGPLEGWHRLYPAIEEFGAVLAYDRPGVGKSPRAAKPQTAAVAVATLCALLEHADLKPPYLLVAHSFGGLHANLFARLHPEEVAAVVFVEATSPDDVTTLTSHRSRVQRVTQGLVNLLGRPDPNGEVEHEAASVAQLRAAPSFPDVPVVVLSGGKVPPTWVSSPEALALRRKHQHELAALSPRGELMEAAGSGHFPQLTEPALVLDAIERAVTKASAG